MTTSWGPGSPFYDAFESDETGRRANYFGRLASQPRKSSNQQKFFESQFEEVQNRYLGRLGQIIQGGGAPTETLSNYLTEYFSPGGGGEYDWMQQSSRRAGGARYNPPVQFNYGTQRQGF